MLFRSFRRKAGSMGGVFGVVGREDCVMDIFFGTDYHSHLGTKRGGMCVLQGEFFNREIHNIENSPFRSKFEASLESMTGSSGIGSISDGDPQPLTFRNKFGHWAITTVGRINNKEELVKNLISKEERGFASMEGGNINNTELVATLISTGKTLKEGIGIAQDSIDGSLTLLILTPAGIYAARDKLGRTPLIIGKKEGAHCAASESFAFINLDYGYKRELGPGEIVFLTAEEEQTLRKPFKTQRICTFLWSYFGYTTSVYEGKNVELMRNRNGALMAGDEEPLNVDYVAGVPDSGTAHALGYAGESHIPYARKFVDRKSVV